MSKKVWVFDSHFGEEVTRCLIPVLIARSELAFVQKHLGWGSDRARKEMSKLVLIAGGKHAHYTWFIQGKHLCYGVPVDTTLPTYQRVKEDAALVHKAS